IGFPGDDAAWKAFGEYQKSEIGPLFFRNKQPVNADGTFTIENMLPGSYQFFVDGTHVAYRQFTVEPEVAGQAPGALDLGEIAVKVAAVPKPDNGAAAAPAEPGAKPTKLDEFLQRVRQAQRGPFGGNPVTMSQNGQIVGLGLAEFELRPGDAAIVGQLPELSRLSLQRSNVTDEDLQQFKALKKLTTLNLWDTKISDAGIAAMSELTSLERLQLGGTDVTDAGLDSVARLKSLQELDLARTKITDAGLKKLAPLWKLQGLKLAETSVSDAGLAALDRLPALRGITLDETSVTATGLERLAMRAPLNYMGSDKLVAQELAERVSKGDVAGVEAMLSIGVDLPHAGKFKTRSVTAHPVTARDAEEQRKRFRIEWDWSNNGKDEGLFAEIAVRQGTASVIEAGVLEADVKTTAKAEAKTVAIRGKAVDDETGRPVAPLIVQAGKFDPADPTKVTWGFSEGRSSAMDGSFSTTIRWADGWTARIIADGYLPQPVLAKAPPEGQEEIEVLVRLKRGKLVRGQVLDHKDQPVKGAAVFAVGPTGVNLAGGKAWNSWGGDDNVPKSAITDEKGHFELPAGEAKKVAVSGSVIDAWPAEIAAEGETIVKLPEPAKVEIRLDIEGADKESEVFFQLLTSNMKGFDGVRIERTLPIANGGKLTLPALPPGKYQFCRQVMNRLGEIGTGAMLQREFIELKAGESRAVNYARPKGARVRGKIGVPAGVELMGIVVSVEAEKPEKSPFDDHEWTTTYASQTAAADGSFLTERIAPGTYVLKVEAYVPLTPEQRVRTGIIGPTYHAKAKIEVPESGELMVPDLKLEAKR
ncbi:MAG TPA: hypothetical protein VFV87_17865, partial [Pirellulaceae bacterium]|nr:hypothetical protein [Pirellulaceae bacterium]